MRVMRRLTLLALCIAGAAAALPAQSSFEGMIYFTGTKGGKPDKDTIVQVTKGSKVRMELHENAANKMAGFAIFDAKAHTITMVMADKQMYMVMPVKEPSQEMQKSMGDIKLTNTGRTETVAGVSCKVYHATRTTDKGVKEGEACLAKGVGLALPLMTMGRASSGGGMSEFRELSSEGYLILKAVEMDKGQPGNTMEAIKIERKSVDASLFTVPAGYTEFHMPKMPGTP